MVLRSSCSTCMALAKTGEIHGHIALAQWVMLPLLSRSLGVTCSEMKPGMTAPPFFLGKPRDNTQIYILDQHLQVRNARAACVGLLQ